MLILIAPGFDGYGCRLDEPMSPDAPPHSEPAATAQRIAKTNQFY
jgi:hypothetical protein